MMGWSLLTADADEALHVENQDSQESPRRRAVDAEIRAPSAEKPEL